MKRTIFTTLAIVLIICLLLFIAFFGLDLGILHIKEVSKGIKLGLDLVGGSEITYEADVTSDMSAADIADGMDTAQTMLRQRLNTLGYTEANVYLSGDTRIVVEIPNVDDPEAAVQMLGTTAVIQFRDYQGKVILEGSDIASATAAYGQVTENGANQYFVKLQLTEAGYEKFVAATAEIATYTDDNNYLAIYMDETVISTPMVSEALDTDSPIITLGSSSTVDYAKYLAEIISAGQLPFALREAKVQTIGASLGEQALQSGILAGIIGVILVMIYMVVFYKIPGIVADFALLVYIVLFLVVMSAVGVNLSLPGIAGIILTVGMAVDANVIIYERLKEELRSGKTLRSAIDAGFKRAYAAIIDSNVTTIIAALVLMWQGTGTILGFAITLLIGVILSMICMLIIPHVFLNALATLRPRNLKPYGAAAADAKTPVFIRAADKFSFVKKFKVMVIASVLLCLVGLGGLAAQACGVSVFNMDLDFMGGVNMEIELGVPVTRDVQEEIASICREAGGVSASVTTAGEGGTSVDVKTVEIDSDTREAVFNAIKAEYGDGVRLESTDFVSAAVGNDLKRAAFLASALALVLMLVYITIRFEFKSGVSAVISLIHDLLVMIAFMLIFQIPMNMTFIAAALTIVGYSINATIVVFDRVRENYKRQGGGDFAVLVNTSVWQTMMRSIGTTATTLFSILFLLILGVSSIRIFAFPLMIGIIAGCFSSVCISGPMWNLMKGKKLKIK